MKLTCECKTRRIDYTCDEIRVKNISVVACDEQCQAKKQLAEEELKVKLARKMELEAEKNRQELELFEKKFGKKAKKERKPKFVEAKKSNINLILSVAFSVSVVLIASGLYFAMF